MLINLIYLLSNKICYFNKISPYFVFKFVRTFIHEYTTWTNVFGYSFMKNVDNRKYWNIHL